MKLFLEAFRNKKTEDLDFTYIKVGEEERGIDILQDKIVTMENLYNGKIITPKTHQKIILSEIFMEDGILYNSLLCDDFNSDPEPMGNEIPDNIKWGLRCILNGGVETLMESGEYRYILEYPKQEFFEDGFKLLEKKYIADNSKEVNTDEVDDSFDDGIDYYVGEYDEFYKESKPKKTKRQKKGKQWKFTA